MAAKVTAVKRKSSSSDPASTAKKKARKDDKPKQLPKDGKKQLQKLPQKRIAAPSSGKIDDDSWSGTSDNDDEDGGAALDETFNGFEEEEEDVEMQKALAERPKPENTGSNSQSSRERHEEQKRLARERRLAKPLGNELYRLKKIWERLRRKSHVPKEERDQLVKELFDIVDGRFKELVLKHDAVRVVQTALKYSTPPQRKVIAKELQGQYTYLASNRYSKFLIDKLLSQGDEEIRDLIVPEFYGKVRKLMLNPEASWVLDDIYRKVATPKQRAIILREWYGPEFAVFSDAAGDEIPQWDLRLILEQEPEKRRPIMRSLMDLIKPLIEKGWTAFTTLHDGMLNYYLNLTPGSEEQKAFFDLVEGDESGDILKHLAFTESGSLLVSLMLAHGSAKDRKLILRAYKDNIEMVASDPNGHVIILAAYEVVDDTVMLAKSLITPILGTTNENKLENTQHAVNDLYARTTILYLFEGASKALFPTSMARDLTILDEVLEIRKTTSKKDPEMRRKELVEAASKPLLEAVASMSTDMAITSFGCQFITGVLLSAVGDKTKALEAVAELASGDPTDPGHVSNSAHGGRMFKTLVQGGRFSKKLGKIELVEPPLEFADKLYAQIKDHVIDWATGPSSFVILGLLEAEDFSESQKLRKTLRKNKDKLERAAIEETAEQKAAREAADANAETGQKKKVKKGKGRLVGNMGAKLILEKLG